MHYSVIVRYAVSMRTTYSSDEATEKRLKELSVYHELNLSATFRRIVKEAHERAIAVERRPGFEAPKSAKKKRG